MRPAILITNGTIAAFHLYAPSPSHDRGNETNKKGWLAPPHIETVVLKDFPKSEGPPLSGPFCDT